MGDTGLKGPDGRHVFLRDAQGEGSPESSMDTPEYTTKDIVTTSRELGNRINIPIYPNNQYMLIAAFLLDPEMEVPIFAVLPV